jgi:hypothetical protein
MFPTATAPQNLESVVRLFVLTEANTDNWRPALSSDAAGWTPQDDTPKEGRKKEELKRREGMKSVKRRGERNEGRLG